MTLNSDIYLDMFYNATIKASYINLYGLHVVKEFKMGTREVNNKQYIQA